MAIHMCEIKYISGILSWPCFIYIQWKMSYKMLITGIYIFIVGAFGLMIGFLYRLSCLLFLIPYWYLFLLDKTVWNNHSYLYGLISILFFLCDAHRYCSVDGLWRKKIRNSHVPLWNYTLFRFQVKIFVEKIVKLWNIRNVGLSLDTTICVFIMPTLSIQYSDFDPHSTI